MGRRRAEGALLLLVGLVTPLVTAAGAGAAAIVVLHHQVGVIELLSVSRVQIVSQHSHVEALLVYLETRVG